MSVPARMRGVAREGHGLIRQHVTMQKRAEETKSLRLRLAAFSRSLEAMSNAVVGHSPAAYEEILRVACRQTRSDHDALSGDWIAVWADLEQAIETWQAQSQEKQAGTAAAIRTAERSKHSCDDFSDDDIPGADPTP